MIKKNKDRIRADISLLKKENLKPLDHSYFFPSLVFTSLMLSAGFLGGALGVFPLILFLTWCAESHENFVSGLKAFNVRYNPKKGRKILRRNRLLLYSYVYFSCVIYGFDYGIDSVVSWVSWSDPYIGRLSSFFLSVEKIVPLLIEHGDLQRAALFRHMSGASIILVGIWYWYVSRIEDVEKAGAKNERISLVQILLSALLCSSILVIWYMLYTHLSLTSEFVWDKKPYRPLLEIMYGSGDYNVGYLITRYMLAGHGPYSNLYLFTWVWVNIVSIVPLMMLAESLRTLFIELPKLLLPKA